METVKDGTRVTKENQKHEELMQQQLITDVNLMKKSRLKKKLMI